MASDESTKPDFERQRTAKAVAFWKKRRHRLQVQRLASLLPPGGMFLDVGGYLGNVTYHVVRISGCRALVFEPVFGHWEFCRQRFEEYPNVIVERLGLVDQPGDFKIFCGHKNLAWNTMLVSVTNRRNRQLDPETVTCVRFDDYRTTHPLPTLDVVKIDVEGFEWRVLHGMRETIANDLPHIECEIHFGRQHPEWDRQAAEFEYLFKLGYPSFDLGRVLDPEGKKIANPLLVHPSRED